MVYLLALPCFASVTSPQTGDTVNLKLLIPICIAALVAIIVILAVTKKR